MNLTGLLCVPHDLLQVKSFYVGENHVGDVPLYKKIAAGFTTGTLVTLTQFFLPSEMKYAAKLNLRE